MCSSAELPLAQATFAINSEHRSLQLRTPEGGPGSANVVANVGIPFTVLAAKQFVDTYAERLALDAVKRDIDS